MISQVFTTADVFDALAAEWDGLLDPRRSDNLFSCRDWQRIWWKHLGRGSLSVVTARDEQGILRGIGPWFIEEQNGQREVHLIGCADVTDYLDILAQPGHEKMVYTSLFHFMLSGSAPAWDSFQLCNIPEDSPTCLLLPGLARSHGLTVEISLAEVCPVIDLPGTYEDYLAGLDKKQRHELRRKRRRAEAQPVDWYIVGPEHDLDREIEAFIDLMALSTPEKAGFLNEPGHAAFFREMGQVLFERGILELMFLRIESVRTAVMWQFAYRDRMMLYNSGLNPADLAGLSPGIVLQTYSIEDAIRRGFKKYDFLRGDEVYKYRMGAHDTRVYNITIRR